MSGGRSLFSFNDYLMLDVDGRRTGGEPICTTSLCSCDVSCRTHFQRAPPLNQPTVSYAISIF